MSYEEFCRTLKIMRQFEFLSQEKKEAIMLMMEALIARKDSSND
jgi:hypothetical protein